MMFCIRRKFWGLWGIFGKIVRVCFVNSLFGLSFIFLEVFEVNVGIFVIVVNIME